MANEKEGLEKKFTRREFVKGSLAFGASALLASCRSEKNLIAIDPTAEPTAEPSKTPTLAKTPTETATALPTPEPTPLGEINHIPGIVIDKEFLQNAFAGIGGEERFDMMAFSQDYVSASWGEPIAFSTLSEEPIDSLKYLVSLGSFRGEEGIFYPGKQQEEVVFPQLEKLSLARLELNSVASEVDQKNQEFSQWTFPQGLLIRPGTQMTVVGLLDRSETPEEITVDKESADNGQLDYALVAFTDYLRASPAGVPRHYLAILPTCFLADPDNKQALTLKNLLETNGYQYDHQKKEIIFTDQDNNSQKTVLELNRIEGEELNNQIRQEVGFYFVDQIEEELIKNPVVPYPEEMPRAWAVRQESDGVLILQAQNQDGDFSDFAKAVYDQEKEAWSWERIFSSEEILAKAPAVEGLEACWEEGRVVYRAEAGNPYNLESGEYAGYLFEFNDETGISSGQGLALAGEVRKKLLEQANTPEAIEQGEWRTTFPFDPRGERIRIREVGDHNNLAINGLSSNIKVRSPFIESTEAKYYSNRSLHVNLYVPNNLLIDSKKDTNYKVAYYFPSAETVTVDNAGRTVGFNELLFSGIGDSYVKGLPSYFPSDIQILITAGNRNAAINLSLSRFLMVDQAPVFGLDKD